MKKLFTLLALLATTSHAFASSIYEYYLDTNLNGTPKTHGNYSGGTSFGGDNLGTINAKPAALAIANVGIKTNASSGDNYNSVTMFYRVYKGSAPAYLSVNLPNISNPSGSGNAEFQSGGVDLLTLPNMTGTYSVDVYFVANATYSNNGGSGTFTSNIGTSGSPLTANFTINTVTLASEITAFSAVKMPKATVVSWQTATEQDNALFQIERSTNAANFLPIGEVKGAGSSKTTKAYSFTDASPLQGVNYYRLQAVDITGKTTTSKIVAVNASDKNGDKLAVFPNPAGDFLRLDMTASETSTTAVNITDLTGRVVLSQKIAVNEGANLVQMTVSSLHSGVYFVRLNDSIVRFVKQ
jgi:Secretion system C-terminal sorting domain